MNISDSTLFYGVSLGKYKKSFVHNLCDKTKNVTKTLYISDDSSSKNFIVSLSDGMECAGTLIEENNWCKAVYIAGISEIGEFQL